MPFRKILRRIRDRCPDLIGAAFCDYEGELVTRYEAGPALDSYEFLVFAATTAAWIRRIRKCGECPSDQVAVIIRSDMYIFGIIGLKEDYYLTAICPSTTSGSALSQALTCAAGEVAVHM